MKYIHVIIETKTRGDYQDHSPFLNGGYGISWIVEGESPPCGEGKLAFDLMEYHQEDLVTVLIEALGVGLEKMHSQLPEGSRKE